MRSTAILEDNKIVDGFYSQLIEEDLQRVKEIMISSAEGAIPLIQNSVIDIVESGGKMLRPAFLILSSKFGDADPERIYRLAAGVEFIHIASLIHDDIVDNSDKRRNRPAMHIVHGKLNAVLLGDFILSKGFSLLSANLNDKNGLLVTSDLVGRICEGEINQNISMYSGDFSERAYKRRIAAKTAHLFRLSFHIGAVESGCSSEVQSCLRKTGYNIGMSFQIIDDILDYTGTESLTGKPAGNDLREGLYTAPLIMAVQGHDDGLDELLRQKPYSSTTVSRIIENTMCLGGIDAAKDIAIQYTKRALKEINSLPEGKSKELLSCLTKELLTRDY